MCERDAEPPQSKEIGSADIGELCGTFFEVPAFKTFRNKAGGSKIPKKVGFDGRALQIVGRQRSPKLQTVLAVLNALGFTVELKRRGRLRGKDSIAGKSPWL
jgi:hypothetical protein